ncbi:MAG: RNA methyltransferase [Patescibacteria group bacterium]
MTKTRQDLYLILNNIRSAYNVGSIFRTADGAGVAKIYLCGITPVPSAIGGATGQAPSKIAKTALGAEKSISWEYYKQALRLLKKLQATGVQIVVLEQTPRSIDYRKFKPKFPMALIVGNEVRGINKKILSYANKIVEIPMYGKKESLNVAVATGIALYQLSEKRR